MDAPLDLELTLSRPAVMVDEEPSDPLYVRVRLQPKPETGVRVQQQISFILDASASMHRFVLDPQQRAYWQQRAEQRGEVTRQVADGHAGNVWSGQTLRELQQVVSTPMLSTLRGVWRTLQSLQPGDWIQVLAFADQAATIYRDQGAADPAQRLEAAKAALGRLGSGVDESGLGRGTRLAGALQQALDAAADGSARPPLQRIILVSDGIIQDREACRPLFDAAMERGIVISVIGVGEEFDEELLMAVADLTRGNYYYAATAPEVEQAVTQELEIIQRIIGRQAWLRLQPESGTIIHDASPSAPSLSEFQTMWIENGEWRFRIGDLSEAQSPEFLIELAPAAFSEGAVRIGSVRVEGFGPASTETFTVEAPIRLVSTQNAMLLQARDEEVHDAVTRLEIYREERRAALAIALGDSDGATKHLRTATRMLRSVGADKLADDMDAAASEEESGTRNLSRTKRLKAATRRLGAR